MYRIYICLGLIFVFSFSTLFGQNKTVYKQFNSSDGIIIPYSVHLPPDYDPAKTFAVLIGPGDGVEKEDPGFYWRTAPYQKGWIIVDTQLWEDFMDIHLNSLLDQILKEFKVEGNKFHTVCWSANSAGIFNLAIAHADRFHSITGMAGNPSKLNECSEMDLIQSSCQYSQIYYYLK